MFSSKHAADTGRQPDLVQQVENDLQSIMAGRTACDVDVEVVEQEEDANDGIEAEKPIPHTAVVSEKAKAGDTIAAAPPVAIDEPVGDGDDDFDNPMEEEDEDD